MIVQLVPTTEIASLLSVRPGVIVPWFSTYAFIPFLIEIPALLLPVTSIVPVGPLMTDMLIPSKSIAGALLPLMVLTVPLFVRIQV